MSHFLTPSCRGKEWDLERGLGALKKQALASTKRVGTSACPPEHRSDLGHVVFVLQHIVNESVNKTIRLGVLPPKAAQQVRRLNISSVVAELLRIQPKMITTKVKFHTSYLSKGFQWKMQRR